MADFWTSRDKGPFGVGSSTTVREAVWRLEQEGFADSQGPQCRKMIWRRRFRHYWRMADGAAPVQVEKK